MKPSLCLLCLLLATSKLLAQKDINAAPNIVIVTIDGVRWQEVFNGADKHIINDAGFVTDKYLTKTMYWADDVATRRQRLLPFIWNVVAQQGQLYGNRNYANHVDVSNRYKFSYPGYNEIFTGYSDARFVPNTPVVNTNTNVLEYLNRQSAYKGKVVAFSSWDIFPYILNEDRCGFAVNSGYEASLPMRNKVLNNVIDSVQQGITDKSNTRLDALTYVNAKEYIKDKHPKVTLISFGEADHVAHQGHYDLYLQSLANVDKMLSDLWYFLQTDRFYRDNTILLITTDHGRGRSADTWTDHLFLVKGSKEMWLAVMGPHILPLGEIKTEQVIYQKQIAATITDLLGFQFESEHEVGAAIDIPVDNWLAAIPQLFVSIP